LGITGKIITKTTKKITKSKRSGALGFIFITIFMMCWFRHNFAGYAQIIAGFWGMLM